VQATENAAAFRKFDLMTADINDSDSGIAACINGSRLDGTARAQE